jgi:catechol 2,3-dioxygenase-like lactoylglutathione lyase family enzyme
MRLHRTMIFVKDLDRMTAFYRGVIGLRVNEATRLPDWFEFEMHGLGLALHAIPTHTGQNADITSPPPPREDQSSKLILLIDDADGELARLEKLGVQILHRAWGGWDFVDPEGNVLGVQQISA